jgi:hypothetical protein
LVVAGQGRRGKRKRKRKGDRKAPMSEWSALAGARVGTKKTAASRPEEW